MAKNKKANRKAIAKKMVKVQTKPSQSASVGHYAFILGVLLAILAGFLIADSTSPLGKVVSLVLIILGLLIGFINITGEETHKFLVAAIALLLAGTLNLGVGRLGYDPIDMLGITFRAIFSYIRSFVAPAALIVALKVVKDLAERQ
ncbi:hypothetical protein J4460_04550 [Candidatus Woesearchaeota archaeon]|nr:hypothetical protein [uncultured archaeon]MBS3129917.1 hypothetical protein [Candidatus Woesearchaeota archaeon]HIH38078.1 hypothetical protein [Candidatus Woesearchaeota archaeon]HIH48175.1 hypothetical protein [Candidatus Woesearchaeota archaeon]HII88771.1 hypothetical protein [Candidatus Woesearchaeota archaeon]